VRLRSGPLSTRPTQERSRFSITFETLVTRPVLGPCLDRQSRTEAMAYLDMPSKSFNFAVLDDYDNEIPGTRSCSTVSIALSQDQESVLGEVSGNQQKHVSSTPDLLSARLERLHIRTPAAEAAADEDHHGCTPVNLSRGLRGRPHIRSSPFEKASQKATGTEPSAAPQGESGMSSTMSCQSH
jgi:hypothetical protein